MSSSGVSPAAPVADTRELALEAWDRIRSVSHDPAALSATQRLMAATGLSLGPVKALRWLPLNGTMPMRELATKLRCDTSYVTSLADALEEKGLARREGHPGDRRVKLLVLTDAGRKVARQVQKASTTPPPVFGELDPDELQTLCQLLRRLDTAVGPETSASS